MTKRILIIILKILFQSLKVPQKNNASTLCPHLFESKNQSCKDRITLEYKWLHSTNMYLINLTTIQMSSKDYIFNSSNSSINNYSPCPKTTHSSIKLSQAMLNSMAFEIWVIPMGFLKTWTTLVRILLLDSPKHSQYWTLMIWSLNKNSFRTKRRKRNQMSKSSSKLSKHSIVRGTINPLYLLTVTQAITRAVCGKAVSNLILISKMGSLSFKRFLEISILKSATILSKMFTKIDNNHKNKAICWETR